MISNKRKNIGNCQAHPNFDRVLCQAQCSHKKIFEKKSIARYLRMKMDQKKWCHLRVIFI